MERKEIRRKIKVTEEGDLCRYCNTAVVKHKTKEKPRGGRAYYFEYYLRCPNSECKTFYLLPASKKFWSENLN